MYCKTGTLLEKKYGFICATISNFPAVYDQLSKLYRKTHKSFLRVYSPYSTSMHMNGKPFDVLKTVFQMYPR